MRYQDSASGLVSAASERESKQPETRTLQSLFFTPAYEEDSLPHNSSSSGPFAYHRESALEDAPAFSPSPPVVMTAQTLEYDRLAVLLYKALERTAHRRRVHEYTDTFYGKSAVDWLVGSGVFVDASDARNALRHLLERRIISRADHSTPLLNDALERLAPEKAKQREIKYRNTHGSANRGFHDSNLYRFPSEAFCETELVVCVHGARNLIFRSRPHVGPFTLHSKFQQQKIDPYVTLQYHTQTAKTDTCESNTTIEWDSEFGFFNEAEFDLRAGDNNGNAGPIVPNRPEVFRDLWLRVYDFHDILGDLELGFCLVSGQELMAKCAGLARGTVWRAWHPLRQSSSLNANYRTYGEIELSISTKPFKAVSNEWTVVAQARSTAAATKSLVRSPALLFQVREDQVEAATSHTITQNVTNVLKKGVGEVVNLGKPFPGPLDDQTDGIHGSMHKKHRKIFTLNVLQLYIHRMSEMASGGEVWAELSLANKEGISLKDSLAKAKSGDAVWPGKELGAFKMRSIRLKHLAETSEVQLVIKVYQIRAGLTIKMGEATLPLTRFLPDLSIAVPVGQEDAVDFTTFAKGEKANIRRVAAFRRNRKILVGDLYIKAVIQPHRENEPDEDEDGNGGGGDDSTLANQAMVLEEELYNINLILSGKKLELPPAPLANIVFQDRIVDCSLEQLIWLVLSKNSPVLALFCAKLKFSNLTQGEWKWDTKSGHSVGHSMAGISTTNVNSSNASTSNVDEDDDAHLMAALHPPTPPNNNNGSEGGSMSNELHESFSNALGNPKALCASPNSSSLLSHSPSAPLLKEGSMNMLSTQDLDKIPRASMGGEDEQEDDSPKLLNGPTGLEASSSSSLMDDFPSRTITYSRAPEALVGALQVVETWRIKSYRTEEAFWMEIEAHTNEPTFGNNMSVRVNLVGEKVSNTTSKLSISSGVVWISRPSLTAGLVERTANHGTIKTYETYYKVLTSVLSKKKKGKSSTGVQGDENEQDDEEVVSPSMWARLWPIARVMLILLEVALLIWLCHWAYIWWLHRGPVEANGTASEATRDVEL
ncbi:hypothetical protein BASA81_002400 [Batrachochytrium salamandrivorans]|nr:hypothetical protein BASA81_002400 [Batrachochytrium salamandrivorans]